MRSRSSAPIRPLIASRIVDQAALGLGSLLLARELGTEAFAPIAVLFVVNSLAVQVSDFGLGFAILRLSPGVVVERNVLWRLRMVGVAMAVLAAGLGLAIGRQAGLFVAASGGIWVLSAESYVRKAAALKLGRAPRVAAAEIAGASVFITGSAVVAFGGFAIGWVVLAFLLKHATELLVLRGWSPLFGEGGERPRSGPEWLSQIFTYLVANVDYVVVAVFLGPSDLSLYVIAFRIAAAAPALLSGPITQSAFLDLAAADEGDPRQSVYEQIFHRASRLGLAGAVLVLIAAPVLPLVLGDGWGPVRPLLILLAFAVPWRLLLGLTIAQGLTSGAKHRVVGWEAARFAVIGVLVLVGVQAGLIWACVAVTVGTIVSITVEHRAAATASRVRIDRWVQPAAAVAVGLVVAIGVLVS